MSHWGQTRLMVGSDIVCKSTTVCPSWRTRLWCIVRGAIWNTDSSESCHPCLCGPPCTGNGNASSPQGRVAPRHQQLPDRPCYAVGWWHLSDELLQSHLRHQRQVAVPPVISRLRRWIRLQQAVAQMCSRMRMLRCPLIVRLSGSCAADAQPLRSLLDVFHIHHIRLRHLVRWW